MTRTVHRIPAGFCAAGGLTAVEPPPSPPLVAEPDRVRDPSYPDMIRSGSPGQEPATVYRKGVFGTTPLTENGSFLKGSSWAMQHPLNTAGYDQKYGLPLENTGTPDWVVKGTTTGSYTTRVSPAGYNCPANTGGATEVYRPQGVYEGVKLLYFHMLDAPE